MKRMKYIYSLSVAASLVLIACGGNSSSTEKAAEAPAEAVADISQHPDYKPGLNLVSKSDCLTCHLVAEKGVGPSYADVARKYDGVDTAVTYLAGKIIAGGSGVWGSVPMTPHPDLAKEDAEKMARYILLLKNE